MIAEFMLEASDPAKNIDKELCSNEIDI